MKIFGPTEKAIQTPRRVLVPTNLRKPNGLFKWVGIGGDIEIKRNAPKKNTIVREATNSEYKWLYEQGSCKGLIEFEEVTDEKTEA